MFSTIQLSDLDNNCILGTPSSTFHSQPTGSESPIHTSTGNRDGVQSEATSLDVSGLSPHEGPIIPPVDANGQDGPGNYFEVPINTPDGLTRTPFGTIVGSQGPMNIHTGHMLVYDRPTFNPTGQMQAHPATMMSSGGQILSNKGQVMTLNRPLMAPLGTMRDHNGQIVTPDGQIIVNSGQIRGHSGQMLAHPNTIVAPGSSYLTTSGPMMAHHGQIMDPLGLMQTYGGPIMTSSGPMMIHPGQMMSHIPQIRAPPGSILTNNGLLMGPEGQILNASGQLLNHGPIMIPPGRKPGFYFIQQAQPHQSYMNPPNVLFEQADGVQMMSQESIKPAQLIGQTLFPESNGSASQNISLLQKKRKERENPLDTERANLPNKNKDGFKKSLSFGISDSGLTVTIKGNNSSETSLSTNPQDSSKPESTLSSPTATDDENEDDLDQMAEVLEFLLDNMP